MSAVKSGKVAVLVEQQEESENEPPRSCCKDHVLVFWIRLMRFAFVTLISGATLCFGPWTTVFCECIAFRFQEDPASTDVDEDDVTQRVDSLILKQFNEIDKNQDGYLTEAEIKHVLHLVGLERVRANDVVAQMDIDGDGKVSFEEFAIVFFCVFSVV